MLLTEYDAKFHEKCMREDYMEEGYNKGFSEGIAQGISQGISQGTSNAYTTIIINALHSGMSESEIVTKLHIPQETIDAAKTEMDSNK